MKNDAVIKQQQRRLFWGELIGFTLIFAVLAVVILNLYQSSLFRTVDQDLTQQQTQLRANQQVRPADAPSVPFQANALVFDNQGQITNVDFLGQQNYRFFKKIKLNKAQRNQLVTIQVTSSDQTANFRTLLVKVSAQNPEPHYAGHYVLLLQNIDTQIQALKNFRLVLFLSLAICELLAIGIAYFLARRSMKPIITAWQRQQDFSADAAHELRTPLTVIQNNLEYLLTQPHQQIESEAATIATALNETARLKKITQDLLTLARADAIALPMRLQTISGEHFWLDLLAPYQEIAASQQKSLTLRNYEPHDFQGDPQLLQQLLVILLDNALKYTKAGDSISVNVKNSNGHTQFSVNDTGQGISAEAKAHIFDRFYRADASRSKQTGGSGLGLAIAQLIVQQHHGQISVGDNRPHGAKFTVTLPQRSNHKRP
ncbi:sensor histidine kinase [Lapidilactobacillus luobeiensis]|uniref:sensor histidine kinase n=1 Tax=Lapidilactobacillus luobeiensis TaxID=2950371 RepID=UPI0021C39F8F|nr:HAMP domain-containing sensor histidine kinase [Lapidilactobacillus luobeiensis]